MSLKKVLKHIKANAHVLFLLIVEPVGAGRHSPKGPQLGRELTPATGDSSSEQSLNSPALHRTGGTVLRASAARDFMPVAQRNIWPWHAADLCRMYKCQVTKSPPCTLKKN